MPNFGFKHSEETKKKISLAAKGRKQSKEWKIKRGLYERGDKSINWNGGRKIASGYVFIHRHKHPFCNTKGYVQEHRLVMEKNLGRYLSPTEVVHHINAITIDNRIENLTLFSNQSQHISLHSKLRKQL